MLVITVTGARQPNKCSSVCFFLHKQSSKQALAQGWLFADMYNPFYLSWVCLGSCCCEALG